MPETSASLVGFAQVLGGVGFALILLAPLARARALFLALDIAGLVPVSLHYWMLDAPTGALLCLLYVFVDVVSIWLPGRASVRRAYFGLYPLAALLTWLAFVDLRDLLALAGTLIAVASRQQSNNAALKALIFASAFGWGAYGVAVGSVSQVVFSCIYAATSLFGTVDELRRRRPPA
jgi:hypothetical protein